MSIFKEYRIFILPTTVILVAVIIVCLFLPKFCYTFLMPIIIGLVTSILWAVLYWIFIARRIQEKEKTVEEAAFKRFHPRISGFVDKVNQNFMWGEKTNEFRNKVEKYVEEHPKLFLDSEKRINNFKAICSDDLLHDFIDTMSRLDNDSWDELIGASNELQEDLLFLHIYLSHISLDYIKIIINLTNKLDYFTRFMRLHFENWKKSSQKDEIKPFSYYINSFHEILKMVDEFMTLIRPILGLGKEETTSENS